MLTETDMSEFQGYTGDCMWLAALGALHALDPQHYNMTAANLDHMVQEAQARHEAGTEGQSTINDVAEVLRNFYGVTVQVFPYAEPFTANWHQLLVEHAGVHPVLLEVAHGGNLHGDEPGLRYHGITQLNRGQYVDGDSPQARDGQMCEHADDDIAAADPCGAIVVLATRYSRASAVAHTAHYTIASGDSLSSIAARLHLPNWYHDLYQPNSATIEAAARAHGQHGSDGGNLVYPDTVLTYQAA